MNDSPTEHVLDTTRLATDLVTAQQASGVDAMLGQLEETLRENRRWHGLCSSPLL